MTTINPRICTTLEGNLPPSFDDELNDKIFYREISTEYGEQVWVSRSAINEVEDEETQQLDSFKAIKEAFDAHPEFDSITLNR